MFDDNFLEGIEDLAQVTNPTPEQSGKLLLGWAEYFAYAEIGNGKQLEEFELIMRMRVFNDHVHLKAPVPGEVPANG